MKYLIVLCLLVAATIYDSCVPSNKSKVSIQKVTAPARQQKNTAANTPVMPRSNPPRPVSASVATR